MINRIEILLSGISCTWILSTVIINVKIIARGYKHNNI